MLAAARDAVELTAGMDLTSFSQDKRTRLAIERLLLIVGEAAKAVSETTQLSEPQLPWKLMISQRNILAHDYGDYLIPKVYYAATRDLPRIIPLLAALLPTSSP
jgi:uncharacterized protein with HEPN domain